MGQSKKTPVGMCMGVDVGMYAVLYHAWYCLQCDGQDIQWSHLCSLYKKNRPVTESPSLAMVYKLKYEHINLTSFSKMRVDLAAQVSNTQTCSDIMYSIVYPTMQVLSSSVANALRISLKSQAAGTALFCEMFNKFFDCLNVSCLCEGKKHVMCSRDHTVPAMTSVWR